MARQRKRIPLEDGLKLDLNKLGVKAFPQGVPTQLVICWQPRYSSGAKTIGLLNCRVASATRVSMRLRVGALQQSIDLVAAPRHFGGVQWYFVCPITGRRASILWLPPGASCFASRKAWSGKVAYASQFETPVYRAMSRAKAIRSRLGDEQYTSILCNPPPLKPRSMHWRTFHQHVKRLEAYEETCDLFAQKLILRSRKA
jgi:hypothetical protein